MAIITSAPQNEAVLSNVGEIGEFRIRNSAKAFNILSSGLYANKVKAIVRELSCNAVDSHIAAGKQGTPFDVHLPNQLEPWFSVRDYGTGLTHEQVTQIYTTYFESTKTASNEFIGALGLGSKSPFSYTDNFTVTAIKDGVKGIYTAFINESGVPSIALMMTENTDEPAGVEVKFSVNSHYDYDKFRQEARAVYTYFALRPVITSGGTEFKFQDITYESRDIIPGVHSQKDSRRSVAIMGNIAYPIDIPQADQSLGALRSLLNCGLEMHFGIGELDFQASREGLSYIPQTIDSIKRKLEELNSVLAGKIAAEADAFTNMWERAAFLYEKKDSYLWAAAVTKYINDTKFPLIDVTSYTRMKNPKFKVEDLAKKYNIIIRAFEKSKGSVATSTLKAYREYADNNARDANGHYISWEMMELSVLNSTVIVFNDTKVGAFERAKYHWRELHKAGQGDARTNRVYVIEPYDRTKEVKKAAFLKAIFNPPTKQIMLASALSQKERTQSSMGKNVTILKLQEKGYGGYYAQKELVWRDAGKADQFDTKQTYYYLPLSGFQFQSTTAYSSNVKELVHDLKESGVSKLQIGTVYGVRKGDIEFIKTQSNWINLETFIADTLAKVDSKEMMNLACNDVDKNMFVKYTLAKVDANSPFAKLRDKFADATSVSFRKDCLATLFRRYAPNVNFDITTLADALRKEIHEVEQRYPLLSYISGTVRAEAVAEYINLIDTTKGI